MEVRGGGPTDTRRLLLKPGRDDMVLVALAAAVDAAGEGQIQESRGSLKLRASVDLRSGGRLSLSLHESGHVHAYWSGQPLVIDSPDLERALEALETELAKAPGPGTRIWAVDPAGKAPAELLADLPKPLFWSGMSPDGRYLLLAEQLGQYKGDYTAIPYLLDRQDGSLKQGPKTSVRFAYWSGNGFHIDKLLHLDLGLQVERRDALAKALGLKEREREIIDISFAADGKRFAALVGQGWNAQPAPLDLVQGNLDGTNLSVVPGVLHGTDTQIGTVAHLGLSPDGQWLALAGRDGAALARAADPAPEQWIRFPANYEIVWAPDSRHVRFGVGGVFDLSGKPVLPVEQARGLVWQDGQGGVIFYHGVEVDLFRLDGARSRLEVPDFAIPRAFLPDGRLLVWHTVWSW